VKLYELYAEEKTYWYQKPIGSANLRVTKTQNYFHRFANGRKNKNIVHSLEKENDLIEGTDNFLQHATEYYKDLFGPALYSRFFMTFGNLRKPLIRMIMHILLGS
jgi:hypothetical protein